MHRERRNVVTSESIGRAAKEPGPARKKAQNVAVLAGSTDDGIAELPNPVPKSRVRSGELTCVVVNQHPVELWPDPAIVRVRPWRKGYAFAGYGRGNRDEFFVAKLPQKGKPKLLRRQLLAKAAVTRGAPPYLREDDGALLVGLIDGQGKVLIGALDARGKGKILAVSRGADPRFEPLVHRTKGGLGVIFTAATTPMQLHYVELKDDGRKGEILKLVPPGGGSSAPRDVVGDHVHNRFVFVDSHKSYSPVYAGKFDKAGRPSIAKTTLATLLNAFEPVSYQVAQVGRGSLTAYTLYGDRARTAVGWLGSSSTPQPLVPSKSFGRLDVDAADIPGGVIFVANGHVEEGKRKTELVVRVFDGIKMQAPLGVLPAPGAPSARFPSVAAQDGGALLVTYTTSKSVWGHVINCS